MSPKPPEGPYPQPLLYGHVGKAPTNSSTNRINRIVLIIQFGASDVRDNRRLTDSTLHKTSYFGLSFFLRSYGHKWFGPCEFDIPG